MSVDDAQLARLAAMTGALLAELGHAGPCESTRTGPPALYQRILTGLGPLLPEDARGELARLRLPDGTGPLTPAELRITHAQLLGWLTALHAQLTRDLAAVPGREVPSGEPAGRDAPAAGLLPSLYRGYVPDRLHRQDTAHPGPATVTLTLRDQ